MTQPDIVIATTPRASHQSSAIVVCQRHEKLGETFDRTLKRWPVEISFAIPRLQRFKQTRLPDLAATVAEIARQVPASAPAPRVSLLVDISVTGRPVLDLLRARNLRTVPVVMHDGPKARAAGGAIHVPTAELISVLSITMAERRLTVSRELPDAETLVRELAGYVPKGDEPDDFVVAVALAIWWGTRRLSNLTKQPRPPCLPFKVEDPTIDRGRKRLLRP